MNNIDLQFLQRHFADNGRVELRALYPSGRVVSGQFDDITPFVAAVHDLRQKANVYYTSQAPKLASVPNRMGTGALGNDDMASFTRIVFDLDTVRTGRAATAPELESAFDLASDIQRFLYRENWPIPVWIHSGNGYHLIYRVPPIPNTEDFNKILRQLYDGMSREFSNPAVTFDRTVRNAGRIMRCPGSFNLKYPDSRRMCEVREWPRRWQQVQPRYIESVAKVFQPVKVEQKPKREILGLVGSGDYSTLDIVGWFQAHGHYIGRAGVSTKSGAPAHGVRCPWVDEHTQTGPVAGGDTVIFEATDSWPGFHCHHAHCTGRTIRDVLQAWGDADAFCGQAWRAERLN